MRKLRAKCPCCGVYVTVTTAEVAGPRGGRSSLPVLVAHVRFDGPEDRMSRCTGSGVPFTHEMDFVRVGRRRR